MVLIGKVGVKSRYVCLVLCYETITRGSKLWERWVEVYFLYKFLPNITTRSNVKRSNVATAHLADRRIGAQNLYVL